jgi:hypothetical protein
VREEAIQETVKNQNGNTLQKAKLVDASQEVMKDEEVLITDESAQDANQRYSLTVSFYSIGEGTDAKIQEAYNIFIDGFQKERNVKISYEMNAWGREGEMDYCFRLTEMDERGRADFIKQSKALLQKSNLVHVTENGICHPKRR